MDTGLLIIGQMNQLLAVPIKADLLGCILPAQRILTTCDLVVTVKLDNIAVSRGKVTSPLQ